MNVPEPREQVTSQPEPLQPSASQASQFSLASLMMLTTLVAVCLALFAAAPGLGITLAIAALPAFIRTALLATSRKTAGKPLEPGRKVALFFGSLGTAIVSSIVVLVASVGAFCTVCLTSGKEEMIPVALIVAIASTIATCYGLFRWYRYRWKRDINR